MFCKGKAYMGSDEVWTAFFFPLADCGTIGASHDRVTVEGLAGAVPWLWGIWISGETIVSDTETSPKRPCKVSMTSSSSWSRSMIAVDVSATVSEWAADLSDTSPACASIAEITSSFVVSVCTPFLRWISAAASCCTCLLISSSGKRIEGKSRWGHQEIGES